MANWLKEEIDQLQTALETAVKIAGGELRESISDGTETISGKIDHHVLDISKQADRHIENFNILVERNIKDISTQIDRHIDKISGEIHSQRKMTAEDIRGLIDYATIKVGAAIDERVANAKQEITSLVSDQVLKIRTELSDAATEQKATAVRNATVAITASLIMALLAILYRKYFHGEINLLDFFRSIFLGITVGYGIWIASGTMAKYLSSKKIKKDTMIVLLGYAGAIRPKGIGGHITLFIFLAATLFLITYGSKTDGVLSLIGK